MTKFFKSFIWFLMLTKRLLHQKSFVVLLCLIPVAIIPLNLAFSQDNGIIHVVLSAEDKDRISSDIMNSLMEDRGVIRFTLCDSPEAAEDMVSDYKADAAWIFVRDFSDKADNYITQFHLGEPFVRIVQREETIPLRIAKEKLFGAMYRHFSFSVYRNFVQNELQVSESISQSEAEKYYDSMSKGNEIVRIERLDGAPEQKGITYLTAPIRGVLSLMIVLCALAVAMYFLEEKSKGKFSWLPPRKRIIPAWASCFGASCLSGGAVIVTVPFAGISASVGTELVAMVLYIFAVTGFCMALVTLLRSPGKFGALIPGIIIVMLTLSPIFFNMKILRPVRLMIPSYYYLRSVYNPKYFGYMFAYCIITHLVGFVLNRICNRE